MREYERSFPELALFGTDAGAAQAIKAARRHVGWRWRLVTVGVVIVSIPVLRMAAIEIERLQPGVTTARIASCLRQAGLSLVVTVTSMSALWLWRRRIHRFLRTSVQLRGIPICVSCGYDLHGLTVARCPECGRAFDSKLLQTESARAES